MGAEQSSPRRMGGEADENEADGSALVAGFDCFFRVYTDVEYLRSEQKKAHPHCNCPWCKGRTVCFDKVCADLKMGKLPDDRTSLFMKRLLCRSKFNNATAQEKESMCKNFDWNIKSDEALVQYQEWINSVLKPGEFRQLSFRESLGMANGNNDPVFHEERRGGWSWKSATVPYGLFKGMKVSDLERAANLRRTVTVKNADGEEVQTRVEWFFYRITMDNFVWEFNDNGLLWRRFYYYMCDLHQRAANGDIPSWEYVTKACFFEFSLPKSAEQQYCRHCQLLKQDNYAPRDVGSDICSPSLEVEHGRAENDVELGEEVDFIENGVSANQRRWCVDVLKKDRSSWESAWVHPPSPLRTYARELEGQKGVCDSWTEAECCWDLLPLYVWDVNLFMGALKVPREVFSPYPCPKEGWNHACQVCHYDWQLRLIKGGAEGDHLLAYQRLECRTCNCKFRSIEDNVLKLTFEKWPLLEREFCEGVSLIKPRSAYSELFVRQLEVDFERGEGAHSTEKRLAEMKHWKNSVLRLQHARLFCDAYSKAQRAPATRQQWVATARDCRLPRGVSVVSDNTIASIQDERFQKSKQYFLCWIQTFVKGRVLSVDHSGKAHAKMSALGRLWRPWDLKVMNEYGQIVMSVRCDSQSWSEENLLQAFDKAHEAGQLDGVQAFFMDNPQQHAAQATANLVGRGELGRFTLHMVEVVEKDVATAVQDIRNNMGDDRVVGFDCEWRAPMANGKQHRPERPPVTGVSEVQIAVRTLENEYKAWVFRIGVMEREHEDMSKLVDLLNDKSVTKCGWGIRGDVARLRIQWNSGITCFNPTHAIAANGVSPQQGSGRVQRDSFQLQNSGFRDLMYEAKKLSEKKTFMSLQDACAVFLKKWLDKRVDHSLWGSGKLLERNKKYAARDAVAPLLILDRLNQAATDAARMDVDDAGDLDGVADVDGEVEGAGDDVAAREVVGHNPTSADSVARILRASVDIIDEMQADTGSAEQTGVGEGAQEVDSEAKAVEVSAADAKEQAAQASLVEVAKLAIEKWAAGCDILKNAPNEMALGVHLSKVQRAVLHAWCLERFKGSVRSESLSISSRASVETGIGDGNDAVSEQLVEEQRKRFVVRWNPQHEESVHVVMGRTEPDEFVGAVVVVEDKRGVIVSWEQEGSNHVWKVKFQDGTDRVLSSWEQLRAAVLKRHAVDLETHKATIGRRAGNQLFEQQTSSGNDVETLNQLQALINPQWEQVFAKYDLYHYITLWGKMADTDKKNPLYGAFIGAVSDALLSMGVGEKDRVLDHVKRMGLLWETTGQKLSRRYWKRHARFHVASPAVLMERLHGVYVCFRDCVNEHGRPFFGPGHEGEMKKLLKYVAKGWLSDKPGVPMYMQVGTVKKTGFVLHRCLRNSSALEGYHLHWRLASHPCGRRASPKLQLNKALAFDFRWNVNQAEKYGLIARVGHSKLQLVDECYSVLVDSNVPKQYWPDWMRCWKPVPRVRNEANRAWEYRQTIWWDVPDDALGDLPKTQLTGENARKVVETAVAEMDCDDYDGVNESTALLVSAAQLRALKARVGQLARALPQLNAGADGPYARMRRNLSASTGRPITMMPPERSIDQGVASGASVGEQLQEKGRAQRACLTCLLSGAHLPACKNPTHKYARFRTCAPGCPIAEQARECPAARGGRGVTASCVSTDAPQSSGKRSRYDDAGSGGGSEMRPTTTLAAQTSDAAVEKDVVEADRMDPMDDGGGAARPPRLVVLPPPLPSSHARKQEDAGRMAGGSGRHASGGQKWKFENEKRERLAELNNVKKQARAGRKRGRPPKAGNY